MKDDFDLPEYIVLKDFEGLFSKVRLDKSRTCVYWNDYVDVPSDIIYEYETCFLIRIWFDFMFGGGYSRTVKSGRGI